MPGSNRITAALPLTLLVAGVLAGCQPHERDRPSRGPESVLAGSTLVSVNALAVPAGAAEVVLQDAAVVPESGIRPEYPYCRFRPGGPTAAPRVIGPPSVYLVTSLQYDERGARRGNETRPVVWFVLQGGPQSAGGQLGCAVPFSAPSRLFVTPAEVQGAVGGYFNLTAAP
ncbi:MAG: hypothetical protein ACREUW_04535 [Burkholderiales bacterium]